MKYNLSRFVIANTADTTGFCQQQRYVTLLNRVVFILSVAVLIVLPYIITPTLLWMYHIERAGRLMTVGLEWPDPRQVDSLPVAHDDQLLAQALAQLVLAQRWRPTHPHTYRLSAQIYAARAEWAQAVIMLEQASALAPDNPLLGWELSLVYEQQWQVATNGFAMALAPVAEERPDRTFASTDSISELVMPDPRLVETWQALQLGSAQFVARGEEARQRKRYAEALRWYNRALLADPAQGDPWYRAGLVYLALEQQDDALYALQQASQLSPASRHIWYELGRLAISRQEPDMALQAFEQGVTASEGTIGLSVLYYQLGHVRQTMLVPPDLEGAWAAYEQAVALDDYAGSPQQKADTFFMRGRVLIAQQRWAEAMQQTEQALALDPQHYWAHLNMAQSLQELGETAAARAYLVQAIELRPDTRTAYLQLGSLYEAEGQVGQARDVYMRLLALDPDDEVAHQALEVLQRDNIILDR